MSLKKYIIKRMEVLIMLPNNSGGRAECRLLGFQQQSSFEAQIASRSSDRVV